MNVSKERGVDKDELEDPEDTCDGCTEDYVDAVEDASSLGDVEVGEEGEVEKAGGRLGEDTGVLGGNLFKKVYDIGFSFICCMNFFKFRTAADI